MTTPPPASLSDRVAEALMRWAENNNNPTHTPLRRPETVIQNAYGRAAAVLAVVQPELDAVRDQAERYQLGALERAALLEDARDVLEAVGLTGAHGDDWPAIAPAIQALAAERDAARRASEESATILQQQIDAQAAELDAMTDLRKRAATAETTIERMKRTNRMVNGGARDARERAERAEAELDAVRAENDRLRQQLADARNATLTEAAELLWAKVGSHSYCAEHLLAARSAT